MEERQQFETRNEADDVLSLDLEGLDPEQRQKVEEELRSELAKVSFIVEPAPRTFSLNSIVFLTPVILSILPDRGGGTNLTSGSSCAYQTFPRPQEEAWYWSLEGAAKRLPTEYQKCTRNHGVSICASCDLLVFWSYHLAKTKTPYLFLSHFLFLPL